MNRRAVFALLPLVLSSPAALTAAPAPAGGSAIATARAQGPATSRALQAYLREVRNHVGENFRNKGYHHQMMFLRRGGATALFDLRADGRVENLHFVNVTPEGGKNVAYFAGQAIREASQRFRPFPPELRPLFPKLSFRYEFGNAGLPTDHHLSL